MIITKEFRFTIEVSSIGKGYVTAEDIDEAKEMISNGEWDDIYDEVGTTYGNLIEIEED